jgi:hypothetical protein
MNPGPAHTPPPFFPPPLVSFSAGNIEAGRPLTSLPACPKCRSLQLLLLAGWLARLFLSFLGALKLSRAVDVCTKYTPTQPLEGHTY